MRVIVLDFPQENDDEIKKPPMLWYNNKSGEQIYAKTGEQIRKDKQIMQ